MFKKTLIPKRDEICRGLRVLHKKELCNLYSSSHVVERQIREITMG
jgi:hypothetical protein